MKTDVRVCNYPLFAPVIYGERVCDVSIGHIVEIPIMNGKVILDVGEKEINDCYFQYEQWFDAFVEYTLNLAEKLKMKIIIDVKKKWDAAQKVFDKATEMAVEGKEFHINKIVSDVQRERAVSG